MKRLSDKKLAQKGGLMIEALAMLGLIAVVTPTMYKKSAERTLEVEDINTAQTMRSVMGAADSYVSSNYGELVQDMTSHGDTVRTLDVNDELGEYLPYGFNASRLYDFNSPEVRVVRNGNNLTSFVLFPAKENGDDGLGQERTVRLATLVGANGGYVNGTQSARGIGGIWALNQDTDITFSDVFGDGNPNLNSIVTASSDAINNTNTEEDTDKFLYRTDRNGKWHNTMRADLYLGGFGDEDNDGYRNDPTNRNFSIRNVKRLIIGSNSVVDGNPGDPEDQNLIDGDETESENRHFGLYMKDDTGNNIDSAFIYGTLEAANSSLLVNHNELTFGYNETAGAHADHFKVSSSGRIDNVGSVYLADGRPVAGEGGAAQWSEVKIGKLGEREGVTRYLMFGNTNAVDENSNVVPGAGALTLIDDHTLLINGKKGENFNTDFENRIVINSNGLRGDGKNTLDPISYDTTTEGINDTAPAPKFPVRVGSNMKVEGILSTAQLDTQNIRAATLEVGSENINDPKKWLRVDKDGIHGSHATDTSSAIFEVHQTTIGIGIGTPKSINVGLNDTLDATEGDAARKTMFGVDKNAGIIGFSSQGINLHTMGAESPVAFSTIGDAAPITLSTTGAEAAITLSTNSDNAPITLSNFKLQQEIKNSELVISSQEASGSETTGVKVKKTNFEVSNGKISVAGAEKDNVIFAVKGNSGTIDDVYIENDGYDVAMHGNVVFTPSLKNSDLVDRGAAFMSIGEFRENSAINIGRYNSKEYMKTEVLMIDTYEDPMHGDGSGVNRERTIDDDWIDSVDGGTVYIRKGLVNVGGPTASKLASMGQSYAEKGYGVVSASRFVANNKDEDGGEVRVPEFFGSAEYATYNGSNSTRYDTYMVNPAYTSVMHDIKLTTRGGARLSDILPDFINKGIYITSNTYLDNKSSLKFTADNISSFTSSGDTINLGTASSWASPYLGFVPAPQCPPGYNRLITLAPQSFMMSQAGQMQRGAHDRGGNAYYVKNQIPDNTAFDHYNDAVETSSGAHTQQKFVDATVATDSDVAAQGNNHFGTAKTGGKAVVGTDIDTTSGAGSGATSQKFLVSFGDETVPLTIQQSTWLKTNVIPVGGGTAAIGSPGTGYIRGWAAIMGFVYDAATYQPVIAKLNALHNDLIGYDSSEPAGTTNYSVYWNIFPVRRNTLEAYATTYCYFDRNGILTPQFKGSNKDAAWGEYIDHYNALKDNNTGYQKNIGNKYRERLNDPTLFYDEVW